MPLDTDLTVYLINHVSTTALTTVKLYPQELIVHQHSYVFSSSDCPHDISLPALPNGLMSCHIADYCTGITCCTDVDLIGRSITTSVDLDVCDYTLEVKIEKLSVNISLVDYQFNKKDQVYLFGAIRLE